VIDGPLSASATSLYQRHRGLYDDEALDALAQGDHPLELDSLYVARDGRASAQVDDLDGPAIIIAGSGMCNGGRIRRHLARHLPDPRTDVLLVGYQGARTLGRALEDGAREVWLDGGQVEVRGRVTRLSGYSAHADRDGLADWFGAVPRRQGRHRDRHPRRGRRPRQLRPARARSFRRADDGARPSTRSSRCRDPIRFFDMAAEVAPMRPELDRAIARVLDTAASSAAPRSSGSSARWPRSLGVGHAVGTSSGTDALLAIAMALGWGRRRHRDHAAVVLRHRRHDRAGRGQAGVRRRRRRADPRPGRGGGRGRPAHPRRSLPSTCSGGRRRGRRWRCR
jgi:hypothetical protein